VETWEIINTPKTDSKTRVESTKSKITSTDAHFAADCYTDAESRDLLFSFWNLIYDLSCCGDMLSAINELKTASHLSVK